MSKIIAVWGSPNSGKTTLAVKLAREINKKYSAKVVVVCADDMTPTIPVIFPYKKKEEMYTISSVLTATDASKDLILNNLVTAKKQPNISFLGVKDAENKFTYPTPTRKKIKDIFSILKDNCDIVIVDCTSSIDNIITTVAFEMADNIIRLANPTLKSISFFLSQLPLMVDPIYKLEKHITSINSTDNFACNPIMEAADFFGSDIEKNIPFVSEVKEQMTNGELLENISNKKWCKAISILAREVI